MGPQWFHNLSTSERLAHQEVSGFSGEHHNHNCALVKSANPVTHLSRMPHSIGCDTKLKPTQSVDVCFVEKPEAKEECTQ